MADIKKIVEELSKLTVLEAVELSKALEETWGVSAAAAVAVAAPGAGAAAAEEKTEFDDEWYESLSNIVPTYFFNSVFNISNLFNRSSFLIKNIKKSEATYIIEAEVYDWFMPDSILNYSKGDSVLLTISIDGDYLNFFCNNQQLGQFVKTNSKTKNEIESLIRNNTCDLSKITWPCHADGSCDYDSSKKY